MTEVRESTTLDQKRVQQRMRHMDQEVASLTRQLSIAHTQVEVSRPGPLVGVVLT